MLTDNLKSTVTIYKYDGDGRLVSGIEYDQTSGSLNTSTSVQYSENSYVNNVEYTTPYYVGSNVKFITSSYGYTYDNEGKLTVEHIDVGEQTGEVSYGYDGHNRLTSISYSFDPVDSDSSYFSYTTNSVYIYQSALTYPFVWEYYVDVEFEATDDSYAYYPAYDLEGNIDSLMALINGTQQYRWSYSYDDLSQLIREDNSQLRQTYVYEYDDAGNILSKKTYSYTTSAEITSNPLSTNTYVYSTSAWGDLLTSYNGTTITYDEIGNPLSYYNGSSYTFGWQGRQLISAVKGSDSMSFEYNDDGVRISKTVNGVTTNYIYNGSLLISEYSDTETIVYIYDANGSPIGFKCRLNTYADDVWDTYWYVKNLQGDIEGIYSSAGVKLATYKYDAWGNTAVSYSNGGASTTAVKNNLTYRGYYYDSDMSMYYLQTRYYDPVICRFINADGYVSTGQGLTGYNMFAYCNNNPVMYGDYTGEFPWLAVIVLVVTTIVGGLVGAYYPYEGDKTTDLNDDKIISEEKTFVGDSSVETIIESDIESNTISGAERARYIAVGATLGLMAGGTMVIVGGTVVSLLLPTATAETIFGATALQVVALGTLSFNVGAVILPAFGIEIDVIDEFPTSNK